MAGTVASYDRRHADTHQLAAFIKDELDVSRIALRFGGNALRFFAERHIRKPYQPAFGLGNDLLRDDDHIVTAQPFPGPRHRRRDLARDRHAGREQRHVCECCNAYCSHETLCLPIAR